MIRGIARLIRIAPSLAWAFALEVPRQARKVIAWVRGGRA